MSPLSKSRNLQSSPLDGLHGAHRRLDLLPRPATKERGEGWGEGLPPVAYLADSAVWRFTTGFQPSVGHYLGEQLGTAENENHLVRSVNSLIAPTAIINSAVSIAPALVRQTKGTSGTCRRQSARMPPGIPSFVNARSAPLPPTPPNPGFGLLRNTACGPFQFSESWVVTASVTVCDGKCDGLSP